jgi:hypothetical protein
MVTWNPRGARFRVKPFSEGIAQGLDATAWPRAGFKNSDVVTCLCELVSSRQPGQFCPDDDDPFRSAPSFQAPLTESESVQ